MKINICL